jgi:hypothetical protein
MAAVCPGKFIYLATPHTASMATDRALNQLPGTIPVRNRKSFGHHGTLKEIKEVCGDQLTGTELVFAAVRNPYDIAVSWYLRNRHQKRYGGYEGSFSDFLPLFIEKSPIPFIVEGSMFSLAKDAKEIVRYERLNQDLDAVMRKIPGMPPRLKLEFENRTSEKKHWSLYYDDKAYSVMNEKFRDDFIKYGYQFIWPKPEE